MRLLPAVTLSTFALCLLTAAVAPASAQQRLRERIAQRLEQRRGHDAPAATALPAGSRVERDLGYGPDPNQRFDIYLPAHARPRAPILLMIHGGGWHRGDKQARGVVANKATWWLDQGYIFVSSNYRLVPDADPLTQARDVATALAKVQQQAGSWGGDPTRVILIGHSAGAHLVTLLGSDPGDLLRRAGAQRPLGVIALDSGALDVPALMQKKRLPQLYRDAFGSDPAYWRSASPQQQLERSAVPMLLVCASERRFPASPCDEARKFAGRGAALAVPMQVLPQALAHGEINDQLGLPSAYTTAVSGWIRQRLMQVRR